jgi:AcrR family transcriptional regulator
MGTDDSHDRTGRRPTHEELRHLRATGPRLKDAPELVEGLREYKRLQTRERLGWAAAQLALRHGLDNVRVPDIAEAAGVSPRTFNNYFGSREEAITALHADRARRVALALLYRPADEPFAEAMAEAIVEEYTHGCEPDRAGMQQMRMIMSSESLRGHMVAGFAEAEVRLAEAIAKRLGLDIATDMLPQIVAAAVHGAVRVATKYWLREAIDTSYTALLREAVRTAAALAEQPRNPSPPGPSLPENANP